MNLPQEIPDNYIILQSTRSLLGLPSYVLTTPIKKLTNIENHVNALPAEIIQRNQASQVYLEIIDSLNTVVECPESSCFVSERTRIYLNYLFFSIYSL